MHNIKVSVIIPIYNVEKYLSECLNSVINQTLKDIEIICIDDCSTDNSFLILKQFAEKDSRIRVFQNEINKGVSFTRNIGIKEAKGEYISFIDSDDYIDLKTYELTYNYSKDLDLDYLLFESYTVDDLTGEINGEAPYFLLRQFDGFNKTVFNHTDTKSFTCTLGVQVGSKLLKKDFLIENNIFFTEGIIFEDESFYYESYLKAKRVGVLRQKLYFYRTNRQNSIIITDGKSLMGVVDTFRNIRNIFIKTNNFDIEYKKSFYNNFVPGVIKRFNQSSPEFKGEFFFKVKEDFYNCLLNEQDITFLNYDNRNKSLNFLFSEDLNEFIKYGDLEINDLLDNSIKFILDINNQLISNQKILEDKTKLIDSKDALIGEQRSVIDSKDALIGEQRSVIDSKDQELKRLDEIISENISVIDSKDALIGEQRSVIDSKDALIKKHLDTISKNNNQLKLQSNSILDLKNDLSFKNFEIYSLKNDISGFDSKINLLNNEIIQLNKKNNILLDENNYFRLKSHNLFNENKELLQKKELEEAKNFSLSKFLRFFKKIFYN